MATVVEAATPGFALLTAVIWNKVPGLALGARNSPFCEIEPGRADHDTAVSLLFVIKAANWTVAPGATDAISGEIVSETAGSDWFDDWLEAEETLLQAVLKSSKKLTADEAMMNRKFQ